jgi:hypothetical protein
VKRDGPGGSFDSEENRTRNLLRSKEIRIIVAAAISVTLRREGFRFSIWRFRLPTEVRKGRDGLISGISRLQHMDSLFGQNFQELHYFTRIFVA